MAAGVVMVAMDVAMARGRLMLSLRLMLLSSMEAIIAMLLPSLMLPTLTPMAMLLPTPSVATPTFGRGRLRPSLAMATDVEATVAMDVADTARGRLMPSLAMAMDVEATVAMDVADTARGRLMLSLRPMLLSSMEATTATLLPSLMPLPTLTPMAMLLPTPSVATPTSGRGRPRLSPAMAAGAVMAATDVV